MGLAEARRITEDDVPIPRRSRSRLPAALKPCLEEFGLEPEAIRTNLAELFERFGWDR